MNIRVFGITNCDSVKKARKWLDQAGKSYEFIDFRKSEPTEEQIAYWVSRLSIDKVLNKRGTTWRKLSDAEKSQTDTTKLIKLMVQQPTLIKRPIIETDSELLIGFDEAQLKAQC